MFVKAMQKIVEQNSIRRTSPCVTERAQIWLWQLSCMLYLQIANRQR